MAVALIQTLAWELPYAVGMALKKQKKKKKSRAVKLVQSIFVEEKLVCAGYTLKFIVVSGGSWKGEHGPCCRDA